MSIHKFTAIDRQQAGFKALQESLSDHLAKLRMDNDKLRGPEETAFLRGQIAAIKTLLFDMGDKPNPTIAPRRNPYN